MPIDPRIPLGVQPAPFIPPLESLGRALAARNQIRQGQDADLRRQITLKQLADADAVRQALAAAGGDPSKAAPAVMAIDPTLGMSLQESAGRQELTKTQLSLEQFKLASEKAGTLGGYAQSVLAAPPPQRPAAYAAVRSRAITEGLLKPEAAPEAYPGDAQVQTWADSFLKAKEQIDARIQRDEAAATKAYRERTAAIEEKRATTDAAQAAEQARHNRVLEARMTAQEAADRRAKATRDALAQRRKNDAFAKLELAARKPLTDAYGSPILDAKNQPIYMTTGDFEGRALQIENAYRDEIGEPGFASVDELPYRLTPPTRGQTGAPAPVGPAPTATAPRPSGVKVGDTKYYQGKAYRVTAVKPNGQVEIEEIR